jgi:hypothetical protein
MLYQIKLLRRGGIRLPHAEVEARPWVVAHVITPKPGSGRLCLFPVAVNLLLNPTPVRELFRAAVHEINRDETTYVGIEQHEAPDGAVAAVAQEWRLTKVSVGSGGWSEARERGVTDDLGQL